MSFIWSIDPQIFEISNLFAVHWSFLISAIGLFLSFEIFNGVLKKEIFFSNRVDVFFIAGMLVTLAGARFFAAFESNSPFFQNILESEFMLEGGIAFLLLFCLLATINVNRRYRVLLLNASVMSLFSFLLFYYIGIFFEPGNWGKPTGNNTGIIFSSEAEQVLEGIFDKVASVKTEMNAENTDDGKIPIRLGINFINELKSKEEIGKFLNTDFRSSLVHYEAFNQHIVVDSLQQLSFNIQTENTANLKAHVSAKGILRHPIMLYKAIAVFVIFLFLSYLKNRKQSYLGLVPFIGLVLLQTAFIALEYFYGNIFKWDIESSYSLLMVFFIFTLIYTYYVSKATHTRTY